jgi:sodium-dependent dicarboxylate transporter 2/3/5
MATFLYEIWKRKWLFAAFAIGILIAILPAPEGLSRQGLYILAISAGAVVIYITEPVPLPTVALLIAVIQVLLGVSGPKVLAKSYMSDSVFFIMGSSMIAVAFVKQKLDRRIAYLLLRAAGGKTNRFAVGVMVTASLTASLIGQHTVAAIMLPVCLVVIRAVSDREGEDYLLTSLLLLSLAYGCTIAGIGTPSGGARNAIMIQYLQDLVKPAIHVSYLEWVIIAYPMLLLTIPVLAVIIKFSFKPRVTDLSRVAARLRTEVESTGAMSPQEWLTLAIFGLTLFLWLTTSSAIGLGTVAFIGAALYLVCGLVEWRDYNNGVSWGVVLLYAAAMSIGAAMVETGAAAWVAHTYLGFLSAAGFGSGIALLISIALLVTLVTNTMSSGAAVAVLAPITLEIAVLAHLNPLVMGFVTAIASAFGFISVASHPGVTTVYSAGYLPAGDFLRHGWKIALACLIILAIYSATYLPFVCDLFLPGGGN